MSKNNSLVRARERLPARKDNTDEPILGRVLAGSLFALMATVLSGLLLISVFSAIALANPDPLSLIPSFALISLMPSMFVGGFVCVKRVKEAPLLCGVVSGALATLATVVLSLVLVGLPSSGYQFLQSAALHSAAILFSILGAFAGNVKKRTKRRFR